MSTDGEDSRHLLHQLMAEDRVHAHRSEDRRIAISCVNVLAASATLIALTLQPVTLRTLPLALWTALLGIAGILLCLKLHERARFHELRARQLRARLAELVPDADALRILTDAEATHASAYPRLSSVRLNALLVALNGLVLALGLLYAVLVLATLGR